MQSYVRDDAAGTLTIRPRDKLAKRVPSTKAPFSALRDIHWKLAIATELYEHHGDNGRTGVYCAIVDVVDYLSSQGIPYAALAPLMAVSVAIADAKRGTASPIFEPERKAKGGKPPTPIPKLKFEGCLAVVTECCVRHCQLLGMRPYVEPGCQLAARLIGKSRWPGRYTATELREIRERVQQAARQSPDKLMFDELLDSPEAERQPLVWAAEYLKHDWVITPPA